MKQEACWSCRFFRLSTESKAYGSCQRYPPVHWVKVGKNTTGDPWLQNQISHPEVLTHHWCGEYQNEL